MTRARGDTQTPDLFAVPQPAAPLPGAMDFRVQVCELIALMLDEAGFEDRWEAAAAISRLAGKDVSKHMLDAYCSPARDEYNAPGWLMPVIETACRSHRYSVWVAGVHGGRLYLGADALKAELGKKEHQRDALSAQIREIKKRLGEAE